MFDKLEDLLRRFEEIQNELSEPTVVSDQNRFRKLMKEQNDLTPIVEAYTAYKKEKQNIEDSLLILEEESDEEMRELAKEELNASKENVENLEQQLKILLLPKDPNDDKNVIVELRAGTGGDEATLFTAEIYRMYCKYAESQRWKTELISVSENGIGGFKEAIFMINGAGAYSKMKYESGAHRVQRVPVTESQGRPIRLPDLFVQQLQRFRPHFRRPVRIGAGSPETVRPGHMSITDSQHDSPSSVPAQGAGRLVRGTVRMAVLLHILQHSGQIALRVSPLHLCLHDSCAPFL